MQQPPSVMATLFVYGSLMADEVLHVLLGRSPVSVNATLAGYMRYSISGYQYPIISKTQAVDSVKGKLLYGIDSNELKTLDLFEGDEYVRTDIIAWTEDGKDVPAATYVATVDTYTKLTPHLSHGWDYEHFRNVHMASFLSVCQDFNIGGQRYL